MTATTYPKHPITMPGALACATNGRLTGAQLALIGNAGRLEASCAARAWNALYVSAKANGHALTWTPGGTYRDLAAQELVFYQRMTADPSKAAKPVVTRFYMGQTWYLLPGMAQVATPGTSNHGLGLAVDMAAGPDPAHAVYIGSDDDDNPRTPTVLQWLLSPKDDATMAEAFGWSWETDSEPWHLHYFAGDAIPQAVLDIEQFFANLRPGG